MRGKARGFICGAPIEKSQALGPLGRRPKHLAFFDADQIWPLALHGDLHACVSVRVFRVKKTYAWAILKRSRDNTGLTVRVAHGQTWQTGLMRSYVQGKTLLSVCVEERYVWASLTHTQFQACFCGRIQKMESWPFCAYSQDRAHVPIRVVKDETWHFLCHVQSRSRFSIAIHENKLLRHNFGLEPVILFFEPFHPDSEGLQF